VDLGADSHTLAMYLRGAAQQDSDLYLMINAFDRDVVFQVQEGRPEQWLPVFDTARDSPDDIHEPVQGPALGSSSCIVRARSIVGLIRGPE
jgi:pullulanase/glycogen debranching enzyme